MTSRPGPEPHMRAIGLDSPARRPTAAPQETGAYRIRRVGDLPGRIFDSDLFLYTPTRAFHTARPKNIHLKKSSQTALFHVPTLPASGLRPYLLTLLLPKLMPVSLPSDADASACAAAAPRATLRSHQGRRTVGLPHMGGGLAVRAARRGPPCALTSAVRAELRLSEHLPE